MRNSPLKRPRIPSCALRKKRRPREEPATVRPTETLPGTIGAGLLYAIRPVMQTPAITGAIGKAKEGVRHSAGYPPVRPANWPGRQYTNLLHIPQARPQFVSGQIPVSAPFGKSDPCAITVPRGQRSSRPFRVNPFPTYALQFYFSVQRLPDTNS